MCVCVCVCARVVVLEWSWRVRLRCSYATESRNLQLQRPSILSRNGKDPGLRTLAHDLGGRFGVRKTKRKKAPVQHHHHRQLSISFFLNACLFKERSKPDQRSTWLGLTSEPTVIRSRCAVRGSSPRPAGGRCTCTERMAVSATSSCGAWRGFSCPKGIQTAQPPGPSATVTAPLPTSAPEM